MKNETKNNSILAGVMVALVLAATSLGMGIANNANNEVAAFPAQGSDGIQKACAMILANTGLVPSMCVLHVYRGSADEVAVELPVQATDAIREACAKIGSVTGFFPRICMETAYRGSADEVAVADIVELSNIIQRVCSIASPQACFNLNQKLSSSLNSDDLKALTLFDLVSSILKDITHSPTPITAPFDNLPAVPLPVSNVGGQ